MNGKCTDIYAFSVRCVLGFENKYRLPAAVRPQPEFFLRRCAVLLAERRLPRRYFWHRRCRQVLSIYYMVGQASRRYSPLVARVSKRQIFEYFGDAGHVSTYASSVRCVLGLRQSSAAHTPVCSCTTGMRVQSTALHSATSSMAAARALPNTNYYPYDIWSGTIMDSEGYHRGFTLLRVRYLACLVTKAGVSVLTPSPFLCAVSWV